MDCIVETSTADRPSERELALSAHYRHSAFKRKIEEAAAKLAAKSAPPAPAPKIIFELPPKVWPAFEEANCEPRPCPSILEIQIEIAKHFKIGVNDILSARRDNSVIRARQISYYLSKELTLFSLVVIARRHGNRDHTTALHGVRKITLLMASDPQLVATIAKIRATLLPTEQPHETDASPADRTSFEQPALGETPLALADQA